MNSLYRRLCLGAVAAISANGANAQVADSRLEEVVITTQKRSERLADVAVSASVVGSDAIARNNISDIADLNKLVPSVNLNGTFNGRVPMGIRGVSTVSNEFTVGLTSGVAMMLDGVPIPSDSVAANALEDIASIEVLKGPQSTLGGRTAASGVINVITRKPSRTLTGNVSATLTDDSEYRLSGFLSGPISDAVAYSLSAYGSKREWPVKNLTRDRNSNLEVYGLRGKLLFSPTDNLDITLAARVGRNDSDGFNFVYTYLTPGYHLLTGAGGPPFLAQNVLLPGVTVNKQNLSYTSPVDSYAKIKDTDASVSIDYRIGDLTLGSVTAYQRENQENVQDLFAVNNYFFNLLTGAGSGAPNTPPPFFNQQFQKNHITQWSEEIKLASPTDRDFSYLLGFFYSDSKVVENASRGLLPALYNVDVTPDSKTYDLYGRSTWKFATDYSLITGLRFNSDKVAYSLNEKGYAAFFPGPGDPRPPVLVGLNYPAMSASGSHTSSTLVGDVSLQKQLQKNSMAYLTYARGYSPEAYNTTETLTPLTAVTPAKLALAPVKKESIDHFELGTKGDYANGTVRLNASLFYTKYKDFQVQVFDRNSATINPPLILQSAGAETKGIELDTQWAATDTLRLGFNAAYVDATFTSYPGAPCYFGQPSPSCVYGNIDPISGSSTGTQELSGKTMPNAPKFKFNLSFDQKVPLSSIPYDLSFGGSYSHRSSAQMLVDQNPQAVQSAFGILNLDVALKSRNSPLTVSLFVNNVFDKVYYVDMEDFWSGPWASNAVVSQPARDARRYFGLRISTGFGSAR